MPEKNAPDLTPAGNLCGAGVTETACLGTKAQWAAVVADLQGSRDQGCTVHETLHDWNLQFYRWNLQIVCPVYVISVPSHSHGSSMSRFKHIRCHYILNSQFNLLNLTTM